MLFTKYNINVGLYPQGKDGKQFIRIRVTSQSERTDLYTGISLKKSQWDKKHHQVAQGHVINNTPYNILNDTIDGYKAYIKDYFNNCAMRDVRPSLTELKERFTRQFKTSYEKQSDEFFYLFDKFMEEKSKERGWGKDMECAYKRLKNIIHKFRPTMKFSDFSSSTMGKLMEEMSKTMYNDTLIKRLTYLKGFLKWADAKNYGVNPESLIYKPKLPKAKKEVRYLEIEEVSQIYEMALPLDSALDRVRDIFVFQCYTALRFSDIKQLKHDNIKRDASTGIFSIDIVTEKDDDRINFPLSNRALAIYNKYKDRKYHNDLLFPVISNQKYNKHLKELGKLAKLEGEWIDYEYRLSEKIIVKTPKEDLSTHTARRTFIVTAINENIDPSLIALITSHSDLKSMKPYITKNAKGAFRVIEALNKADKTTTTPNKD